MNSSTQAVATAAGRAVPRDAQAALYTKVTWRLVPLLFACYVAAYLDRVNVGFAKLQMLKDLQFSETMYGLGAGIFFIGYFLFEVPSNIILHKVGARLWIARVMITWALISAATMFVRTPTLFYILRFALGLAEAGLFPGVILYLTYWYPSSRRGKIIALFMTGIPISGLIGGPLSGWILHSMGGLHGLAGWQWLFLLEALPSLVLGVVVALFLDNGIDGARWLSQDEKRVLRDNVAADRREIGEHSFRQGLTHPLVWALSGIYLFFITGLYGVGFWLPTLIKGSGVTDPLTIGLLSMLPYAAATISMIFVGRSSDARRERRWHVALPGLIGTLGWIVALSAGSHHVALAMLGLTVATMGVMTALCQFWCLPVAVLAGAATATGVAAINSIGNLAGFVGPYAIGWLIDTTHSNALAVDALAAALTIGALLVLTLPRKLVNR